MPDPTTAPDRRTRRHPRTGPVADRASAARTVVPAGRTLGVEEEYHVVDRTTLALRDDPQLNAAALRGRLGDSVSAEISTTQLEIATGVCTSLAQLRADLGRARAQAREAALLHDALLLPASTHPFARWDE